MKAFIPALVALCLLAAPVLAEDKKQADPPQWNEMPEKPAQQSGKEAAPEQKYSTAIFAGGCFWCMESEFDEVKGVIDTISGYTGGQIEDPTYEQVSKGNSGHFEALKVTYDPAMVSYDELLDIYWQNIDPFDAQGQFCDKGYQYRPAIFFISKEQHEKAIASHHRVQDKFGGKPLAVLVMPAQRFWYAEDHHQNYHQENPSGYKFYRTACGRDSRLEEVWGKKAEEKKPEQPAE